MRSIVCVVAMCCALAPVPVSAQSSSAYVSVLAAGDVVRGTSITNNYPFGGFESETNGEALALLLRAGTPLGGRWGVEFEFGYGGEIEDTSRFPFALPNILMLPDGLSLPFPGFAPEVVRTQQRTTYGAALWHRMQPTDRVDVTVLGGLTFQRVRTAHSMSFLDGPIALSVVPTDYEVIEYGAGPMAGIETGIGLTRRLAITAGARLHAGAGGRGWLMRPAAGLRWSF